ncbi:Peptidoglycan-recognition protein SC2 [Bulinus truncatus]|nr:Peptidoglycan-recognition protein SC2 [Bulinus truncatus]
MIGGQKKKSACPHVVTRAEWGARPATGFNHLVTPVQYAFIHHTAGADCHDRATCSAQVRLTQNYHMDGRGYSDIGYSFMIGGNGEVFEGRGWDHLGAHTLNYNSHGYGKFRIVKYLDTINNIHDLSLIPSS